MKIYFAGVKTAYLKDLEPTDPILVSFANANEKNVIDVCKNKDIVLDSGAFTTWRSGRVISDYTQDIKIYCDFIKSKAEKIAAAIAMDVICGSAEDQLSNLDLMLSNGIDKDLIWPVFHEGDDIELLSEYILRGFQKIAIAGTVSRGKPELIDFLYSVFSKVPPSENVKYHGLAMTQQYVLRHMKKHFNSVDSTTWLGLAAYGLKGSSHLLKEKSINFYRKVGRLSLLDGGSDYSEFKKSDSNQLSLFDELEVAV